MKLPHLPHLNMPKCAYCCADGARDDSDEFGAQPINDAVTLVSGTAVCREHATVALGQLGLANGFHAS